MKSMEKVPLSIESAISKNDNEKFERSSLGKMLHADMNISQDSVKKITDAIATGKKIELDQVWKDNLAMTSNRSNGHNS